MPTIYRNFGSSIAVDEPSPNCAQLERERLAKRKVPIMARIEAIDRALHPMATTPKAMRSALMRERHSLVKQISFIDAANYPADAPNHPAGFARRVPAKRVSEG